MALPEHKIWTVEDISHSIPDYIKRFIYRLPGGFICKTEGRMEVLYVSHEVLRLFECDDVEEFRFLTGGVLPGMILPEDWDRFRRARKAWADQVKGTAEEDAPDFSFTYRILTKTGKAIEVNHIGRVVSDPQMGLLSYIMIFHPDTFLLGSERDTLTRLPNGKEFYAYAGLKTAELVSRGYQGQIHYLYLNLQDFKRYNARNGYSRADNFLVYLSMLLRSEFASGFVSRLGDDHFAVFTTDGKYLTQLAAVRERLGRNEEFSEEDLKVGIYTVEDAGKAKTPSECTDYARVACNSLREDPDLSVRFYSGFVENKVKKDTYILDHFQEALEKNYIRIYYQPVIRSLNRKLAGFEALSRWVDPQYGLLNPADFIPVLEQTHQITELDFYLIDRVCAHLKELQDKGQPVVPVSFNLSRTDFKVKNVFEEVEKIRSKYGISPSLLDVELAESIVIENKEIIQEQISLFHRAGYQVWMDDFGSGYSSLNVLKDYQFDLLKIDMSFLSSFNSVSKNIIASVIRMAKSIHIHTLAEGVEKEEHEKFLSDNGCELLQGFFFDRPEPYEQAVETVLKKGIGYESAEEKEVNQKVGAVNFQMSEPFMIADFSPELTHISCVYANEGAVKLVGRIGNTIEEETNLLNEKDSILMGKMREYFIMNDRLRDGKFHPFIIAENGHLSQMFYQLVAESEHHFVVLIMMEELDSATRQSNLVHLENEVAYNLVYSCINAVQINLKNDTFVTYFPSVSFKGTAGEEYKGARQLFRVFCDTCVYPDDRERYREFADLSTVAERISATPFKMLIAQFRSKDADGKYTWKVHNFYIPHNRGEELIYTIRQSVLELDRDAADFYEKRYGKSGK